MEELALQLDEVEKFLQGIGEIDAAAKAVSRAANLIRSMGDNAINIVIDESEPPMASFVELENDLGAGIRLGTRSEKNGLAYYRITEGDIRSMQAPDNRLM